MQIGSGLPTFVGIMRSWRGKESPFRGKALSV